MEHAKKLWEKFNLPALQPEAPWHGYELGDWSEEWDQIARKAASGEWIANGERSHQRRRRGLQPNTDTRHVRDDD